jgi:hypothetical protein
MKISRQGDRLIADIPLTGQRSNPYDESYSLPHTCVCGLIDRHDGGWDEIGFAHLIDMEYKGKMDQAGGFILMWEGSEDDFLKTCEQFGLEVHIINA